VSVRLDTDGFVSPSLFFFLHILQKILTLLSQKLRNKVGKKFENGHLFLSFFTFMKIVYEKKGVILGIVTIML